MRRVVQSSPLIGWPLSDSRHSCLRFTRQRSNECLIKPLFSRSPDLKRRRRRKKISLDAETPVSNEDSGRYSNSPWDPRRRPLETSENQREAASLRTAPKPDTSGDRAAHRVLQNRTFLHHFRCNITAMDLKRVRKKTFSSSAFSLFISEFRYFLGFH